MERPSGLSTLSPAQLERASFTPRAACESAMVAPVSESSSESMLQAMQKLLAIQEARIASLENQMRNSSGVQSPARQDGYKDCSSHRTMSTELRQQLQHDLHAALRQENTSPANSFLYTKQTSPPSLLDDLPTPTEGPLHLHGRSSSNLLDDLTSFEPPFESAAGLTVEKQANVASDDPFETLVDLISCLEVTNPQKSDTKPTGIIDQPSLLDVYNSNRRQVPWDGTINYTLCSSPFSSSDEESAAVYGQPRGCWSSGFFQHGLFFKPHKTDDNAYRTVALTNLPLNSFLRHLISAVRGGPIYSAHLMNMKKVAGFHMGVVKFLYEKDARAYVEFAKEYGVFFDGQRANVMLYKTATYPISTQMEEKIAKGHTRCVSIKGPRDPGRYTAVAAFVEKRLPVYFDMGDDIIENDDQTELQMSFNSIEAASAAMEAFRHSFRRLDNCDLSFAPDPCARPFPTRQEE
ncbi:hypothetical protein FQN55_008892 [Onygenales sp. PD_40]|nr:hypothetical protein FQN55_008892 [Onygenales sp. PD_40]KAK2769432.1 hypothetical protein FQN53_006197 [Emmonsiellopsis sp. PD_33]KAK2781765.1 hypothetical protein FQN52_001349 [Onygenales sp. PD_12]KAK2796733.1 hypothetical protein FQN51_009071 [Onygenales sp. PD_10]